MQDFLAARFFFVPWSCCEGLSFASRLFEPTALIKVALRASGPLARSSSRGSGLSARLTWLDHPKVRVNVTLQRRTAFHWEAPMPGLPGMKILC